jgi:stage III sporulation protein AE
MGGPVKLLQWLCTTLLTALTTIFTLCLTLSGALAASGDKLASSLTKTAVSAALPVVGSILADAADTYLAGAELVRSGVGLFGLAAVLCVCIGPVIGLGLHYLLFKAAACIAEPFADGRLAGLMGHIATAYGMALGLLGSGGVMLFMSISVGTGVLSG